MGIQPKTRSPKVSATQSTWRCQCTRLARSTKPGWSWLNHPGSVKWWRQTQVEIAGVAGGAEHRPVVLHRLGVVLARPGLESGPLQRQAVVGQPVLGEQGEVLGVAGGEAVAVTGSGARPADSQAYQSLRSAAPSHCVDEDAVPHQNPSGTRPRWVAACSSPARFTCRSCHKRASRPSARSVGGQRPARVSGSMPS